MGARLALIVYSVWVGEVAGLDITKYVTDIVHTHNDLLARLLTDKYKKNKVLSRANMINKLEKAKK